MSGLKPWGHNDCSIVSVLDQNKSDSDQPRDKQGRWVSIQQPTDLRKLFITAMEGRRQRPYSEMIDNALPFEFLIFNFNNLINCPFKKGLFII